MVQVRVITKGMDFNQIAKELEQDVRDLKRETLESMASVIAQTSPVDSGFYARNHTVGLRSGSFAATTARPDSAPRRSRGSAVDVAAARTAGFNKMMGEIGSIDLDSNNFVFRNPMAYSSIVEAEYAVYARARREVSAMIQEAVARIGSR